MRSRLGLNSLNFLTAAIQAGFGPFIAVWLTQNGWSLEAIGFALSIGTFAQVIAQVPGGWLVDHIPHKRYAAASGLIGLGIAALLLALMPSRLSIWGAEVTHAVASALMTPAIAALTLTLCGHDNFGSRLGLNARYASLGAAGSAALLGFVASLTSNQSVFMVTAFLVVPALAAVLLIRPDDAIDPEGEHPALLHPKEREHPSWAIFREPGLHLFAAALVLFQLANAGMLPAALNVLARRGEATGYIISACIIVPQIIVAMLSPWAGRMAERIGRRPVLLVGFAAVPLRALLFATLPGALPTVAMEALDGVSAAVVGLMLPLIAADVTRKSGFLNFAIGSLGLASALGATFSTTLAGLAADRFGDPVAFLGLGAAGAAGLALLAFAMPETRLVRSRDVQEATLPA